MEEPKKEKEEEESRERPNNTVLENTEDNIVSKNVNMTATDLNATSEDAEVVFGAANCARYIVIL